MASSRAILCIHGSGSSPLIFRFQISSFGIAMKNEFDFVFATGPHEARAGPEVLPFFKGMDPYFTWFRDEAEATENKIEAFNASIRSVTDAWATTHPESSIVGVLGFSQGALAATLLLWQQQAGKIPWLPRLRFGILICSGYNYEATEYMRQQSGPTASGDGDGDANILIKVPTIHLLGRQDWALRYSKMMLAIHYSSHHATAIEFEGRHECPRQQDIIRKVVDHVRSSLGTDVTPA
ncbi:oxidoreductase [Colletotrichum incanum]|uniref:Oxidoreductase n=1 Tax=Colletotrichum incanum TaxID=1573173 RepID=A0A162NP65_COLIC|nr:oxidoreductase [Colletotrichum incanum]OHW95758.1 oxidoreductase [Colletotrichum incanum]